MKLVFVTVSGRLPPWLKAVTEDYQKKLAYWFTVENQILPGTPHGRDARDKKKTDDALALLKIFRPDDFIIVCDERGHTVSTPQFAKRIEGVLAGGKKRLIIVVGGAYGLTEQVLKRADFVMSLSALVTSHHMAYAFIQEQAYRAMTILKNIRYHNE